MRRSMLVVGALLMVGSTLSCDRIKQAIEQRRNRNRTPATQTTPQTAAQSATDTANATPGSTAVAPGSTAVTPADTATRPQPTAARPVTRQPPVAPPATQRPAIAPMLHDEPYNSPDTGTVAPGMSQNQVIALWGPPAAIRHAGDYTYLHYRNGCEYSCGTDDVVILQNDQVVDAIVRWPGHGYSGQSSSPPGSVPEPTPPTS